jgi:uncharacterized repeat protein (TIGR04076 family)
MAKQFKVVARVASQKGTCAAGHRVGDEFAIEDCTPAGMCSWAFYTIFPFATVLQFGGAFPWEDSPGKAVLLVPTRKILLYLNCAERAGKGSSNRHKAS